MNLSTQILDYLRASDRGMLAKECDGHFSLAELEDAARTGEVSADLEDWLGRHRQAALAAGEEGRPVIPPVPFDNRPGSPQDAPSMGMEKAYQQGPPG
jgi:hypothetical protein